MRIIEQINNLRSTERSLEQDRETNLRSLAEIQYNLIRLGRLTERWGSRQTPTGKTIRAEQALAPDSPIP